MSNRFEASLATLQNNEAQAPAQQSTPETKLLSGVIAKMPPQKSRGVGRTYYLSKEVAQALDNESKQRRIKPSNLVNEVLKQVLLDS